MNKLNELYKIWETDPSQDNLSDLLETVRKRVIERYCCIDNDFEDIAQNTVIQVWRSLPGYGGEEPLKTFDPNRADFAAFCATAAYSQRLMIHRSEHTIAVSDEVLERLLYGEEVALSEVYGSMED